jgi:hypothetical protein
MPVAGSSQIAQHSAQVLRQISARTVDDGAPSEITLLDLEEGAKTVVDGTEFVGFGT